MPIRSISASCSAGPTSRRILYTSSKSNSRAKSTPDNDFCPDRKYLEKFSNSLCLYNSKINWILRALPVKRKVVCRNSNYNNNRNYHEIKQFLFYATKALD